MWRLIGITLPYFEDSAKEKQIMLSLLESNSIEYFHIRKPDFDVKQMKQWLEDIPLAFRHRLCLNDHIELAIEFSMGGIHLNRRNNYHIPSGFHGRISRSCHCIAEVEHWKSKTDYVFLSPVFDSISKTDYKSGLSKTELKKAAEEGLIDSKVFALSGVEPAKLPELKAIGFSSAAMMGAVWQETFLQDLKKI